MCGILVVVGKDRTPLDLPACRRALSLMTWRGPDLCASEAWEGRVFMGQTVLSLTGDISSGRGEHLASRTGRYRLAYNGEIYNYKELADRLQGATPRAAQKPPEAAAAGGSTGRPAAQPPRPSPRESRKDSRMTDSEVLVNLHEELEAREVGPLLDGMYAYAVLDTKARRLILSRDVQGEKGLYIYEDDSRVVISSEIRAILALAPRASLDVQALRDYFRTRHLMLFERTIYRGVRQLAPGRLETLDLKTMRWGAPASRDLRGWINPARMEALSRRSPEELASELDAALAEAARGMLPAGRRWAAVVSGGVDSSLTSSHLTRGARPDLLIAVNHLGKDRISSDLAGFEKSLGLPIEVLEVDRAPYSAEIARCQEACGSPLLTHSFVPQSLQSARVASKGCRVLFGGEGGDEYFGGYDAYLKARLKPGRFSPSPYTGFLDPGVEFDSESASPLESELAEAWSASWDAYRHVKDDTERAALAMMYCDAAYQLPAVGLRGSDLMSMMWSVEARSLLVRRPVVELALNLPLRAKLDVSKDAPPLMRTKPLLKRAFLKHYPGELLVEKQGFSGFPNESAFFLGDLGDFLAFEAIGLRRPAPGRPLSREALWKLTNIEWFLRSQRAGAALSR